MRGDIYELPKPRDTAGHEQSENRYCVVMQRDSIPLSTVVVCPTSASARDASFRPTIDVRGQRTHVLTEQITAVDPRRLGKRVGSVSLADMLLIQRAVADVLGFL